MSSSQGPKKIKALVVTGSRADRNGLEVVHEALLKAGHQSTFAPHRSPEMARAEEPEVIIVGGDRIEILQFVVHAMETWPGVPFAHIAGGDVTAGSADDRYRDAITALSCIHFATNMLAYERLTGEGSGSVPLVHEDDCIELTGSPAIDRIKQTPVLPKWEVLQHTAMSNLTPIALACVHPNTDGQDPLTDFQATAKAMAQSGLQCVWLGANADMGGHIINFEIQAHCQKEPKWTFFENVSPQLYYSLMTHCDVMVGNSSAMLYEAPCFGLPCVLVGDRQKGREIPWNVCHVAADAKEIERVIRHGLDNPVVREELPNPYGDGQSAPRIVKALEDNAWRWESKTSRGISHGQSEIEASA